MTQVLSRVQRGARAHKAIRQAVATARSLDNGDYVISYVISATAMEAIKRSIKRSYTEGDVQP